MRVYFEFHQYFCFYNIMIGAVIFCFYLIFYSSVYCSEVEDCNDDYCLKAGELPRFEGDMLGFNNIDEVLNPVPDQNTENAALMDESKKWPQGKVYYKLSRDFTCKEKCIIYEAMQELETKTCLTFTQDDRRDDFIEILPSLFCASYVGRQGNRQHLFLAPYCASSIGMVIHEIMHALGFFHEQSRKDRDDYIDVNWDNIAQYNRLNFANHGLGNVTTYDLPYDYESLMHYAPYDFAKNVQIETIKPKHGQQIGQREKMSELDVERINIHYNCTKKTVACIDKWRFCNRTTNVAVSCRNVNYERKCQKTCKTCQNLKQNQHEIGSINCRKTEDRCTTWSTNGRQCSDDNQLKKIVKSRCYLSCQLCRS